MRGEAGEMAHQKKNAAGESFNMIQFHLLTWCLALNSSVRRLQLYLDQPRAAAGRAEPHDERMDTFTASFYQRHYYSD